MWGKKIKKERDEEGEGKEEEKNWRMIRILPNVNFVHRANGSLLGDVACLLHLTK